MSDKKSADSGFPGIAFATLPATGETIAIRYDEHIYYRVQTSKTAEELNAMYGVSQALARNVLERVLSSWETAVLKPENRAA
ncbi:MAG: hypothetical protein ACYDBW_01780 [Sulfuricaulis sp.]